MQHHGDTESREAFPTSTEGLPEAALPRVIDLADGATTELRIGAVTKQIGDERVRMLAYSGSIPGPTLRVHEGSQLIVDVENDGDLGATVHWHGLRLDNRYDGTQETQAPMPIGGSFSYRLDFPYPGIYWYHPHIRQDYGQEMSSCLRSRLVEPTTTPVALESSGATQVAIGRRISTTKRRRDGRGMDPVLASPPAARLAGVSAFVCSFRRVRWVDSRPTPRCRGL